MQIKKVIQESIKNQLLERKSDFDEYELTTCILDLYRNPDNTTVSVVNLGNNSNPSHAIFINLKKGVLDVIDLNNQLFESSDYKKIDDIIKCFNDKSFNYNILKRLDIMISAGSEHGAEADYIMYDDGTFSININAESIYDLGDKQDPLKHMITDLFVKKVFYDVIRSASLRRVVYHEFSHFYTDIKSNYQAIKPDLSIKDEDLLKHNYANDYNENQARFAGIIADLNLALSEVASGSTKHVSKNITSYLKHLKQYQETKAHLSFEKAVNALESEYNDQTYGWKKLSDKMKTRIQKRVVDITMHINEKYDLTNIKID